MRSEVYCIICIYLLIFSVSICMLGMRGDLIIPISGCILISFRPALRPSLAAAKAFSHSFNSRRNVLDSSIESVVVTLTGTRIWATVENLQFTSSEVRKRDALRERRERVKLCAKISGILKPIKRQ